MCAAQETVNPFQKNLNYLPCPDTAVAHQQHVGVQLAWILLEVGSFAWVTSVLVWCTRQILLLNQPLIFYEYTCLHCCRLHQLMVAGQEVTLDRCLLKSMWPSG